MTAYNRMMQRSGRFIPQGVLIAAVSLTLLLPACRPKGQAKSSAPSLPNILLISLDACRADHLSCYGYARKTSPFLDALAAQGTRFARAFCNTHGTGPSHATLLMSLYQETHRMEYTSHPGSLPGDPVPPDAMMIQEFLHARGYTTLGITDGGQLASGYGFHRGFDVYDDDGGGIVRGCRKLTDLVRAHIGGGRPLFIFYHTYEVHSPYLPPEHLRNVFGTYAHTIAPVNEVLGKYAATAWRDLTQGDLNSSSPSTTPKSSAPTRCCAAPSPVCGTWDSSPTPWRWSPATTARSSANTAACSTETRFMRRSCTSP